MPFAPRHQPKPRSPYAPLWMIPVALSAIALSYFCVVRPAYEIYTIERYLSEQERKHEQRSSHSPITNRLDTNALSVTNMPLEQRTP